MMPAAEVADCNGAAFGEGSPCGLHSPQEPPDGLGLSCDRNVLIIEPWTIKN